MDIAHIVPVPHLNATKHQHTHMCLASIAKEFKEYRDFYKECSRNGKNVILDNGMFEGDMLDTDELLELLIDVEARVVIAPDHLGDAEKTIEATCDFCKRYTTEFGNEGQIMAVPHGKDLQSLKMCFEAFLNDPELWMVSGLGFSYLAFESATNNPRVLSTGFIFALPDFPKDRWLHLLGLSKQGYGLAELVFFSNGFSNPHNTNFEINFESVDTSLAATLAFHDFTTEKFVEASDYNKLKRPENFFELSVNADLLKKNMEDMECLISS